MHGGTLACNIQNKIYPTNKWKVLGLDVTKSIFVGVAVQKARKSAYDMYDPLGFL